MCLDSGPYARTTSYLFSPAVKFLNNDLVFWEYPAIFPLQPSQAVAGLPVLLPTGSPPLWSVLIQTFDHPSVKKVSSEEGFHSLDFEN